MIWRGTPGLEGTQMLQELDDKELDKKTDTDIGTSGVDKWSLMNRSVPVLTFMMAVICIVLLVLVISLSRKVDGLEASLQAIQASSAATPGPEPLAVMETGSAEVLEPDMDETEVVELAEAVVLKERVDLAESRDEVSGIRRVYLTFDDGPSSNTDKILDILDQYGVKATFFVVGREDLAEQYKRIVADGHTLAMHSYSHKYKEIYSSLDAYQQDLEKLHDFLYEITGEDCNIVRFPGGSSNTVSRVDMRDLAAYLDEEGMVYFDWNISSGDAVKGSISADQIARNVLDNINKYDNAVILFHDAGDKRSTVAALPVIIEKILESENTVMLPISEDTELIQHVH